MNLQKSIQVKVNGLNERSEKLADKIRSMNKVEKCVFWGSFLMMGVLAHKIQKKAGFVNLKTLKITRRVLVGASKSLSEHYNAEE